MDSRILYAAAAPIAQASLPQATLAFEYNPTSDANLPGIAAADNSTVNTATDMTGNGLTGTAPTTTGPERKIAGINGVNVFNFKSANVDLLIVNNALAFSKSQYALGVDGVLQLDNFTSTYSWFRIPTAVAAAYRFGVQITTAGKFRILSRRLATDANNDQTSTIGLTVGVASFVSIQVDYAKASIRIVVDGLTETLSVVTGGAPGWTSGTGPTESSDSFTTPNLGRIPSGTPALNAYMGSFRCWTGDMPISAVQTQRTAMQALFNTPLTTVAVDPPTSSLGYNKFYRAVAGVAAVPVSGTVILGADADIEMRRINAATLAADGAWATIATSAGGVWSATPSIPEGSWYLQFRKVGERDVDAVTDTANRVGVGFVLLMIGQSNGMRQWAGGTMRFSPYPVTLPVVSTNTILGSRRWSGYGWFSPTEAIRFNANGAGTNEPYTGPLLPDGCGGNGLTQMCLQMQTEEGVPLCVLGYNIGGTDLESWLTGGSSWSNLLATIDVTGGPGWNIDGTLLVAGEANANAGTSKADYMDMMGQIHDQLRAETGDANTKLWVSIVGASTVPTDAEINEIIDAQIEYCATEPDAYLSYSARDAVLLDSQHPVATTYEDRFGPRIIQTMRYDLGLVAAPAIGPEISGGTAAIGANSANVTVTQHGGTTLLDAAGSASGTGLTSFTVEVDGTARNVTAALNAGSIDLTWDGAATVSTIDIGYMRGAVPDVGNCIYDDTTIPGSDLGAPLQPTNGLFRITAT